MKVSKCGKYTFFYSSRDPFSNWYSSKFTVPINDEDVTFCCSEQFMMYAKAKEFGDEYHAKKIMESSDPAVHKAAGRLVSGFDAKIWSENCEGIMEIGLLYKFTSSKLLKDYILSTGDTILVEASPNDKIWGIGLGMDDPKIEDEKNWQGQNLLGKALMKVRKQINYLRKEKELI